MICRNDAVGLKSFPIWQTEGAKLQQIVLCFSGRAGQLVRERQWHPSIHYLPRHIYSPNLQSQIATPGRVKRDALLTACSWAVAAG
jgi:hypothetical protein